MLCGLIRVFSVPFPFFAGLFVLLWGLKLAWSALPFQLHYWPCGFFFLLCFLVLAELLWRCPGCDVSCAVSLAASILLLFVLAGVCRPVSVLLLFLSFPNCCCRGGTFWPRWALVPPFPVWRAFLGIVGFGRARQICRNGFAFAL